MGQFILVKSTIIDESGFTQMKMKILMNLTWMMNDATWMTFHSKIVFETKIYIIKIITCVGLFVHVKSSYLHVQTFYTYTLDV
jgi:hypothetical protein